MPRTRTTTASLNARLTPHLDNIISRRADRHDVTHSEAARQLLQLGSFFDAAEQYGVVITKRARALLSDGDPSLVRFVIPQEGDELVTTEAEAERIHHGAVLICAPEDMP